MQENEIQSVEGYKPVTLKGSLQIHRFAGIIIKDFENKEKTIIPNDFEIEFDYFKTIDQTKEDDSGVIRVYGLKPSTVKTLQQGGGEVEFKCGYLASEVGTLFIAKIVRLYYDIKDNTTVTTIEVSANLLKYYQVGYMSPDGDDVFSLWSFLKNLSKQLGVKNGRIDFPDSLSDSNYKKIIEYIETYYISYSAVGDPLTMIKGVADAIGFEHKIEKVDGVETSLFNLTDRGVQTILKNVEKGYRKVRVDPETKSPITKNLFTYEDEASNKEFHILTHQTGLISSKTEYKIAKAYQDQELANNEEETDESIERREKRETKDAERAAKEAAKKAKMESEGKTYKPPKERPQGGRVEISVNRRYNRIKALLNPKILPQSLIATEIPEEEYEYLKQSGTKMLVIDVANEIKYFTFSRVRSATYKGNNKTGDWIMDLYCEDVSYNFDMDSDEFKEFLKNKPIDEYVDENGNVEDGSDYEGGIDSE